MVLLLKGDETMKEGFYVAMDTETVYSKKDGYSVNKMTVRQYVEHPKFRC